MLTSKTRRGNLKIDFFCQNSKKKFSPGKKTKNPSKTKGIFVIGNKKIGFQV